MRGAADRFPEKMGAVEGMIYQLNTPGGLTTAQEPLPELIRRKANTKSEWELLATSVSALSCPQDVQTSVLTIYVSASRSCELDQSASIDRLHAPDPGPHGGRP